MGFTHNDIKFDNILVIGHTPVLADYGEAQIINYIKRQSSFTKYQEINTQADSQNSTNDFIKIYELFENFGFKVIRKVYCARRLPTS